MAKSFVAIRAIKPKKMNISAIKKAAFDALHDEAKALQDDFEATTSAWKGAKPTFRPKIKLSVSNPSVRVGPAGSEEGVNKWHWLDKGTPIRWAVMSPNWKSKTRPRTLNTRRGRGNVIIAGRRAMSRRKIAKRPGIEARGWSAIIITHSNERINDILNKIEKAHKNIYD